MGPTNLDAQLYFRMFCQAPQYAVLSRLCRDKICNEQLALTSVDAFYARNLPAKLCHAPFLPQEFEQGPPRAAYLQNTSNNKVLYNSVP